MQDRNYAGVNYPQVNITMPVFNRPEETLRAIRSVRERTQTPYFLTVVDNGSETALRKELLALHQAGMIDYLYFLDRNYGVSCGCNTGWKLHKASFYMKLDNDMEVLSDTWLNDIFLMWGRKRYATLFGPIWNAGDEPCRMDTPYGSYWEMPLSVSGQAFLVSAKIVGQMGFFCEDYGIYGEEDADYCFRCHHAGIRKYTFEARDMLRNMGTGSAPAGQDIDRVRLHNANVGEKGRKGIFPLNLYLYEKRIRPFNITLKYEIAEVRGHDVVIRENPRYPAVHEALRRCLDVLNDPDLAEEAREQAMRRVFAEVAGR